MLACDAQGLALMVGVPRWWIDPRLRNCETSPHRDLIIRSVSEGCVCAQKPLSQDDDAAPCVLSFQNNDFILEMAASC